MNNTKDAFYRGWTASTNMAAREPDVAWELYCSDMGLDPETAEECEHPEDLYEFEASSPAYSGSFTVYTLCGVCGATLRTEEDSIL